MLATILFSLLSSCLLSKKLKIKYTKPSFYLLFYMGMELGLSHQGKNAD